MLVSVFEALLQPPDVDQLVRFWDSVAHEIWFREHPLRSWVLSHKTQALPIGLWGDDAPLRKCGPRQVRRLHFFSPFCDKASNLSKSLGGLCPKVFVAPPVCRRDDTQDSRVKGFRAESSASAMSLFPACPCCKFVAATVSEAMRHECPVSPTLTEFTCLEARICGSAGAAEAVTALAGIAGVPAPAEAAAVPASAETTKPATAALASEETTNQESLVCQCVMYLQ